MRRPRLDLPGLPVHATHRGNNRAASFADGDDCQAYLQALREACGHHGVAVHGYVLMTNHVHLLATPGTSGAMSRVMQSVGRRYVRAMNTRYGHTGTP